MELSCLLEVLGLRELHWLLWTPWVVHSCLLCEGNLGRWVPTIHHPTDHEHGHNPVRK